MSKFGKYQYLEDSLKYDFVQGDQPIIWSSKFDNKKFSLGYKYSDGMKEFIKKAYKIVQPVVDELWKDNSTAQVCQKVKNDILSCNVIFKIEDHDKNDVIGKQLDLDKYKLSVFCN